MNIKKLFIATFIFLGISLFAESAFAETFFITQGNDGRELYATVQGVKQNYSPNEQVFATVCLVNNSSSLNNISLSGGTNGTWNSYLTSSGCKNSEHMGNAPSNPGTYAVNYSAGFNRVSAPPLTPYVIRVAMDPNDRRGLQQDECPIKARIDSGESLGSSITIYVNIQGSGIHTLHNFIGPERDIKIIKCSDSYHINSAVSPEAEANNSAGGSRRPIYISTQPWY